MKRFTMVLTALAPLSVRLPTASSAGIGKGGRH